MNEKMTTAREKRKVKSRRSERKHERKQQQFQSNKPKEKK